MRKIRVWNVCKRITTPRCPFTTQVQDFLFGTVNGMIERSAPGGSGDVRLHLPAPSPFPPSPAPSTAHLSSPTFCPSSPPLPFLVSAHPGEFVTSDQERPGSVRGWGTRDLEGRVGPLRRQKWRHARERPFSASLTARQKEASSLQSRCVQCVVGERSRGGEPRGGRR